MRGMFSFGKVLAKGKKTAFFHSSSNNHIKPFLFAHVRRPFCRCWHRARNSVCYVCKIGCPTFSHSFSTIMHQSSLANDSGDILKTYHTRLDGKKRVVIRNPQYTYYEVREFNDGHIELLPRILVSPEEHDAVLSQRTLQMLDTAAQNLAHGVVSAPIDTRDLRGNDYAQEQAQILFRKKIMGCTQNGENTHAVIP